MSIHRKDQSVISDEAMTKAFREGLAEGLSSSGSIDWALAVEYDGSVIYQGSFPTGVEALSKAAKYLDTPGTRVTILVRQGEETESDSPELEDGIVDIEEVE